MSDVLKTSAEVTDKNRKLWLDTRGVPVITTTKNGEANAIRWGWTEARAVAADALEARQVDEAALAEIIREADVRWQMREQLAETADKRTHSQALARAVVEFLGERHEPGAHNV